MSQLSLSGQDFFDGEDDEEAVFRLQPLPTIPISVIPLRPSSQVLSATASNASACSTPDPTSKLVVSKTIKELPPCSEIWQQALESKSASSTPSNMNSAQNENPNLTGREIGSEHPMLDEADDSGILNLGLERHLSTLELNSHPPQPPSMDDNINRLLELKLQIQTDLERVKAISNTEKPDSSSGDFPFNSAALHGPGSSEEIRISHYQLIPNAPGVSPLNPNSFSFPSMEVAPLPHSSTKVSHSSTKVSPQHSNSQLQSQSHPHPRPHPHTPHSHTRHLIPPPPNPSLASFYSTSLSTLNTTSSTTSKVRKTVLEPVPKMKRLESAGKRSIDSLSVPNLSVDKPMLGKETPKTLTLLGDRHSSSLNLSKTKIAERSHSSRKGSSQNHPQQALKHSHGSLLALTSRKEEKDQLLQSHSVPKPAQERNHSAKSGDRTLVNQVPTKSISQSRERVNFKL